MPQPAPINGRAPHAGRRLPTASLMGHVSTGAAPRAVSVVICAASDERWDELREAVTSVERQTVRPAEIVVVIDHNDALLARARAGLAGAVCVANKGGRGASGARNTGVAHTTGEVLAFLDDDATAEPDWLERLLPHFGSDEVVGVGGRILPRWLAHEPAWLPQEFAWVVGATYRGLPETVAPVRNVWSGNMAIRRTVFEAIGGFRADFGKVGTRSRPEDTELCVRAAAARPGGAWLLEPSAVVHHNVPAARTTPRFFARRCWAEGIGKAQLAELSGGAVLRTEWRYAVATLVGGTARSVAGAVRHGDLRRLGKAPAIVGGLGIAFAGNAAYRLGLIR